MNNNYTHLAILLDRSGSMQTKWSDTIGALQAFFEEQKKVQGKMTISLVTFGTSYTRIFDMADINLIHHLKDIHCSNEYTALYDSFCRMVDEEGQRLANMNESDRPGKVIFLTSTDGDENRSLSRRIDDVKSRLSNQKEVYSWKFVFLGSDFDAERLGTSLGNSPLMNRNYRSGEEKSVYRSLSANVASFRSGSCSFDSVQ